MKRHQEDYFKKPASHEAPPATLQEVMAFIAFIKRPHGPYARNLEYARHFESLAFDLIHDIKEAPFDSKDRDEKTGWPKGDKRIGPYCEQKFKELKEWVENPTFDIVSTQREE